MTDSHTSGVDWSAVDAVIFDVDGTLFDHVSLRRPMLIKMLAHLVTGRLSWRDIHTVRVFRRERERMALEEADNIGVLQLTRVASMTRASRHEVEALVSRWMYDEPLAFVTRHAFPDARRFVATLSTRGIRTGVFSDYPAGGKLHALGISVDVVRDATAEDVGRLKPHPEGFTRVCQLLQTRPHRCLIIGDRDDRDGEAARRGDFMFLKKVPSAGGAPGQFESYARLLAEIEQ